MFNHAIPIARTSKSLASMRAPISRKGTKKTAPRSPPSIKENCDQAEDAKKFSRHSSGYLAPYYRLRDRAIDSFELHGRVAQFTSPHRCRIAHIPACLVANRQVF